MCAVKHACNVDQWAGYLSVYRCCTHSQKNCFVNRKLELLFVSLWKEVDRKVGLIWTGLEV